VTARSGHTATLLLDGRVLVAGGSGNSPGDLASAEIYDPATETFTSAGGMTVARSGHTATRLLDGRVLIVGGVSAGASGATGFLSSAELYDPATGTFGSTGWLTTARANHTATLLSNGKVLVAGGMVCGPNCARYNAPDVLDSAELYDPSTGRFEVTGSLVARRYGQAAALLAGGAVLVTGGVGWDILPNIQHSLASAELYEPATGLFTATGTMTQPRLGFTATLLPTGLVLLAGGSWGVDIPPDYAPSIEETTELYDPASGTFAAADNMRHFLYSPTTTLLHSGKALVVGQNGVELFDPDTGRFSAQGGLLVGAFGHSATLLASGKVLVVGGDVDTPTFRQATDAAQLYLP
jgi:hypothetical protein